MPKYKITLEAYTEAPNADEAFRRVRRFFGISNLVLKLVIQAIESFKQGQYPIEIAEDGRLFTKDIFGKIKYEQAEAIPGIEPDSQPNTQ